MELQCKLFDLDKLNNSFYLIPNEYIPILMNKNLYDNSSFF